MAREHLDVALADGDLHGEAVCTLERAKLAIAEGHGEAARDLVEDLAASASAVLEGETQRTLAQALMASGRADAAGPALEGGAEAGSARTATTETSPRRRRCARKSHARTETSRARERISRAPTAPCWRSASWLAPNTMAARLSETAADDAGLLLADDTTWFRFEGRTVDLSRRLPVRLVLRRLSESEGAVNSDELVAAGWPGERMAATAASQRLRHAIATLRKLGSGTWSRRSKTATSSTRPCVDAAAEARLIPRRDAFHTASQALTAVASHGPPHVGDERFDPSPSPWGGSLESFGARSSKPCCTWSFRPPWAG